jgi:hypothetical protein
MGLFDIVGSLGSMAVKTVTTPLAVLSDTVSVATGNEATATKKHISSIQDDLEDIGDEFL